VTDTYTKVPYVQNIAVYSKKHSEQIKTLHGQDMEFHNIRSGGTQTNYWVLQS